MQDVDHKIYIRYPRQISLWGKNFLPPQGLPIGGFIKLTYFLNRKVLQFFPALTCKIDHCFLEIIKRWFICPPEFDYIRCYRMHRKVLDLAIQSVVNDENDSSWLLLSPKTYYDKSGVIKCDNITFQYWTFEMVNGELLRKIKPKTTEIEKTFSLEMIGELYKTLIMFLSRFHCFGSCLKTEKYFQLIGLNCSSLKEYYSMRLINIKECLKRLNAFEKINNQQFNSAIRLAKYFLDQLDCIVMPQENISLVHGDYREDNIIIQVQKKKVYLIDFDQGFFGGDWLVDLWKFGLFSNKEEKFDRILSYNNRLKLIQGYFCDRISSGDCSYDQIYKMISENHPFIKKRINLLYYDLLASLLILRSLMGWYFKENIDSSGRKLKGVYYILDLIDKLEITLETDNKGFN